MFLAVAFGTTNRGLGGGGVPFRYCRQGSSLPWTPTLRPFVSRPSALAQEEKRLVDDVCECMLDVQGKEGLSRREQLCRVLVRRPF